MPHTACHAGIGWRQPHYRELLQRRPSLAFVEVHSENFFADGGAAVALLHEAREHYAVSLHGVGLALGSAAGLDPWHLDRLARLVERIDPVRVSDHASFARGALGTRARSTALTPPGPAPRTVGTQERSTAPTLREGAGAAWGGPAPRPATTRVEPPVHANDLLPVAFTPASLDIMAANVEQVQERLKRPILVENLSAYLTWADDTLPEAEFFNRLARRTGCGVLLDVNNLVVNSLNAKSADPVAAACGFVDVIDAAAVREIHLAGYNDAGALVIDDHGSRVHEPVWRVYRHAVARLGAVPTLIEWDTDVPALDVLLDEVELAERALAAGVLEAA